MLTQGSFYHILLVVKTYWCKTYYQSTKCWYKKRTRLRVRTASNDFLESGADAASPLKIDSSKLI